MRELGGIPQHILLSMLCREREGVDGRQDSPVKAILGSVQRSQAAHFLQKET